MVDYLSNRSQYVFVNRNRSDVAEIVTGGPQGSVLGPFLFLVYINDFPQTFQSDNKIALFADDTSIIKTAKGSCNLQNVLDKICDCFIYNKLSINATKCETMSFGSNYQNSLTVHNEVISRNTCCKYLGVYIDSKLTFRDHINHVVKKGSGRFGTRRFGNKMAEDVSATFCCRNVFGAETSSQQVKDVSATFCDFF